MKFTVLSILLASYALLTLSFRDPNNPPTGRTGAPNETTCAASGCHNGGSFTGAVELTGVPDTVVPNQTYVVTLKVTSNCVRSGFELTCLDSLNAKCGTLSNITGAGTNVTTASSRQYVRQATPKVLSGGSTSWNFNWKAPAAAAGNKATFYFVGLCANGNGNNSGDNVKQANKVVRLQAVSPTSEVETPLQAAIYPSPVKDVLHIDLEPQMKGTMLVYDLNGKKVSESSVEGKGNSLAVNNWPKGIYIAEIRAEGRRMTKRIVVE